MTDRAQDSLPALSRWQPYPDYRNGGVEWLGEIPSHWSLLRLKATVGSCINGIWGDEANGDANDIVCVRVADFDRAKLKVNSDNLTVRSIPAKQQVHRRLESGDLLLEKSGGGEQQLVGAVVMYDLDEPAVCSNFIARIRLRAGYDSAYLTYLHFCLYAGKINYLSINQTTGIQNLDSNHYLANTVGIPPLSEQRAIAAFLNRETAHIDRLIAAKERLIALLQEKRAALISHAVTKGLDPTVPMKDSEVEWLGEIPAHWEVKRIGHISDSLQTGPFGSQLHSEDYVHGGVPVINPSHLKNGTIEPDWNCAVDDRDQERLRIHQLVAGDIVFARRGELGRCALVTDKEAGWLCGTGSLRMRPNKCVTNPVFLNWVNATGGVAEWLLLHSVGSTMDNLNTQILSRVPLPVPPLEEQAIIAGHLKVAVGNIDTIAAKTRQTIDVLREYRAALITAAVTGKIDVRKEQGE